MNGHTRSQFESLTGAGIQAFRAGRAADARSLFERAVALPPPTGARRPWAMLAQACRQLGDVGAETREWREGKTLIFDDSFEH